jgi:hypothetical protein
MKAFGLGNPSLTHRYPPPASGIAEPSSAYPMAVKRVIIALIIKATITEPPARPIAGPVRTNMAPPTSPAIPIIMTSTKPNERTKCSCGGVSSL